MMSSTLRGIKLTSPVRAIMFAFFALGAAAALAETPKYGGIRFDCDVTVDGRLVAANTAVYAETWPTQMCVKPVVPTGETFFRFESDAVDGVAKCPIHFYLQMDGSFFVVPPAFSDTVRDFRHVYATHVLWVDAKAKDGDVAGDGSKNNPWHTLQYAVSQVSDNAPTIIFAKPGDYDEGGEWAQNASNRVVIAKNRTILLRAEKGPSTTAIVGEADETSNTEWQQYYPKMGPLAKRCVYIAGNAQNTGGCCVQGFTLRDGHASQALGNDGKPLNPWGDARTQGSAVYSEAGYINQVVDCVVTDCTAGKSMVQGTILRTLVTKCYSANSLFDTAAWAVSCAFVDDYGDGRMGEYVAYPGYAHQNMLGGSLMHVTTLPYASMSGGVYWNGAYGSQFIPNAASKLWGSIFVNGGQGDSGGGVTYVKTKEQFFADSAHNDARIIKGSLAETGVKSPAVGSTDWLVWATNYAAVATSDINGNRILFRADDGTPSAGAYQDPVQAFVLSVSTCDFEVESPSGGMCGSAGETITIKPTDKGTRYADGVTINGVTYVFKDQPGGSVSYTVPDGFEVGSLPVTVHVSNIWYLDAVNGKDTNKGISPATAWKTLAYASGKLGSTGMTFRLLPGVYDEGVTWLGGVSTGNTAAPCRFRFFFGATVESTDGPEKTIVKGADAPGEDADEYGCGIDAVGLFACYSTVAERPVRIRGLTLTGGRTRSSTDGTSRPFENCKYVGSVINAYQADYRYITLENCIITNNACNAYTVRSATIRNCVFDDNHIEYSSSVSEGSSLDGCLIKSGSASSVKGCRNTTFCKGTSLDLAGDVAAFNSVIGGSLEYNTRTYGRAFTNCIVATTAKYAKCQYVDCVVTNFEAIGITDEGIPTNRASLVVDAANPAYVPDTLGDKDALGGQRVYNGTVDIGAVEYDWRNDYAKDIAKREVVVSAADPQVVEREGKVTLDPGASLTAEWTPVGESARCDVKASVTGTGTLTVSVDGVAIGTVTAADSPKTFNFAGAIGATSKILFSYSQEEGDEGCAVIEKVGSQKGFLLLVR